MLFHNLFETIVKTEERRIDGIPFFSLIATANSTKRRVPMHNEVKKFCSRLVIFLHFCCIIRNTEKYICLFDLGIGDFACPACSHGD